MNPAFSKTALPSLLGLTRALAPLLVAACSGTETDNPVVEAPPPDYRSPIRFEPDPPTAPGCPPPVDDAPPRRLPLWGQSGNYLVGIDVVGSVPRRGLVVLDVSDPAAPRVVAEQPLQGYPRQLLVEGNSATLVIDELAMFDAAPVPAPAALEPQTKLVRFDLSTPSAPRRIAEAPLDGEFWQLEARADGYWVMSGHIDPATQRCDVPPNLCGYVSRDAMVFTHHTWSDAGWGTAERLELPAGPRVWLTEAGFATASSYPGSSGELSYAAFAADGSLGPVHTLPLADGVVDRSPLYFDSQHVGLFSYDLSDGSAAFALYALDGTELGRVRGLGQGLGAGTLFVPGGALVASGNPSEAGSYIDFSDPSALRRVSLPQAAAFLPLAAPGEAATRALGWKTQASGNATTFSLWGLGSAGATLLDSLPTTLAAPQQPSDLELTDDRVVFSLRGADSSLTGSLSWDGDALSLAGPIAGGYGYGNQHLAVGDWLYEPDALGLAFGNPSQGDSAQRQAWDEGRALDVSAVPGGEARLVLDDQRGVQVFVTRGGVTQSIPVAAGAERLLPAGERLIVLSTEPADQCSQTSLDCTGYAPNLAILELDPLRIVQQLPLPALPVPALSEPSRVEQSWQAPVRLGEQTWLLESEYSATCFSKTDCQALGIQSAPITQANTPLQASCAPPMLPSSAPSCPQPLAPTVYGEAERRVFYVLDAAAARLSDPLVVDGVRGTPYTLWTQPVFSQNTVLDLHLEPSSDPTGGKPSPTSSAFMLERYVLNAAGLDALPVINVPGYPVALIGEAELLTLEPDPGLAGTAQLHRLRLGSHRATLEASRALGARVGTAKVLGQSVVYLQNAADACEPVTHLQTFALDADLTPRASLELPGDGWVIIGSASGGPDDSSIVLQRERGFVKIAIDAEGNASLTSFATTPSLVGGAQLDGNVVRAISGNQVLRLSL
jgi:hypothetical protein